MQKPRVCRSHDFAFGLFIFFFVFNLGRKQKSQLWVREKLCHLRGAGFNKSRGTILKKSPPSLLHPDERITMFTALTVIIFFCGATDILWKPFLMHFWVNRRKHTLLASSPEALAASRGMASSFISNPFPLVFSQPSLYLTWQTEAQVSRNRYPYSCPKLKKNVFKKEKKPSWFVSSSVYRLEP